MSNVHGVLEPSELEVNPEVNAPRLQLIEMKLSLEIYTFIFLFLSFPLLVTVKSLLSCVWVVTCDCPPSSSTVCPPVVTVVLGHALLAQLYKHQEADFMVNGESPV